ncbi:Cell division protein FtsK [Mucinivorans hirudinis]|uniref:Cell division protein FtsK n=1 Tax=Mucinivorans hirudinis TaxID=1433126 RepID=A0A060RBG4_9BACT|nr:Cell division protein FtsK [Mucinivorans hirudinis]
MDNDLLIKLLENNNRLIFPSLGAFLKKEQGAGTKIVFSPFLKKDDGVLAGALADYFSLESGDAETMVAEYVTQINRALSQRGEYCFDGIGVLQYDPNGTLIIVNECREQVESQQQPTEQQYEVVVEQTTKSVEEVAPAQRAVPNPTVIPRPTQPTEPPVQLSSRFEQTIIEKPIALPPRYEQPAVPRPLQQRIAQPQPSAPKPAPQPAQQRVMPLQQPPVAAPQRPPQPPRPQSQQPPRPPQAGQRPPSPRPPQRQKPQKPVRTSSAASTKTDTLLVVAIIAAALVLILIVWGYLNTADFWA